MSAAQENQDRRAIIKDALARIENLQARLAAAERSRAEPIAIIGLGCRFPGGADGPDSYWRLLQNGVDAVREVPPDRWDVERYFDPDPHAPGKTYTRWGGYLDRVDMFDAEFFGIPPREALTLDPQQRLFLEVVWEALEHAGLAPDKLRGSQTGVFLGLTTTEYLQHLNKVVGLEEMDAYHASGNTPNAASGRVAHLLGLHGPAVSLDTACSSSLVAAHIACQSLRNGDCDMALAGGVNVILIPETYVCFSKWGMMSHVGRCRTFDASADGFVRSEGCGVVVLKRLSDAIASGDTILALIRGSAVNQDGPSSGLSVPNGLAQQNVIRRALENARVKPEEVGYVEAHGTGTTLGDPIEVEALGEVFGPGRTGGNPLAIGSVKTNLGHMESAAGIAGMIKVVLALQHREIPPHLHLSKLTPRIPWERLPFVVPTDRTPWPVALSPRIAGVSSFGFSGTNAHVVLEEAPPARTAALGPERTHHLLALSAKNDRALRELAGRYVVRTLAVDSSWPDVCHTAGIGRSHFSRRAAVVAASSEEARAILSDFAGGGAPSGLSAGEVHGGRRPKIAFLFSGQGAQYVGMGRRLYETSPVFRETLDRCDELLEAHLERRLLSVFYPEDGAASPLDDTAYTQPALFALEYALAALWRSWGVTPSAVMGHSVGEFVAACLAGVMRLEDALELIAARGRLMQELPRDGAMAAVFADEGRVAAALAGREDRVSIAAVNGPTNVVVSGRSDAVAEILDRFGAAGVRFRRLNVSHAFHSPLMDPILDSFERVASRVSYEAPRLPLMSGATGQLADADLIGRAGYWRRHVRQTVRFEASVRALHELGFRLFLEVGPGTTLLGMGRQCVSDPKAEWLHSLCEGREDWSQILGSLGALYVLGAEVDWAALDRPYPRRRVSLPTYPFRRRRFWVDSKGSAIRPADSAPASASTVVRLIQEGNVRGLEQELAAAGVLPSDGAAVVPKVLDALIRRHRDEIAAEPRERMYELRWREKPRSTSRPAAGARTSGVWLVFADDGGIGRAVSAGLESRGARSVVVCPGSGPARDDEGTWRIDPARPEDYRTLIEKTSEGAGASLAGVIHLWSLDTVRPEPMTLEALDAAQRLGCRSLLFLAQALAAARGSAAPRLWAVTRGTVPAEQPPLEASLAQAPVWGLGGVLALEIPEIWGGLVDLPADVGGDHAERLLEEVWEPDGEDQVALRAARRFVPRLVRHEASGAPGVPIAADGTYLVTGGLGGLGLEVAHWLARRGARHVMLLGRRGVATEEAKTSIERLEKIGVSVRVAAADVADPEAMDRILAELAASMPPLRGILHAAGVAGYEPVEEIDAASLAAVLRPKLAGTWNLYRLTREMRLDFFVGFSSIASLWGSKGQAHYAAANFFLDAFAHTLRGQGRPALSVNWGPWTTGMSSAGFQSFMARLGVRALSPEEAKGALGAAIDSGRPQIAVATVDWRAFKAIYEARGRRPILDEIDARADQDAPAETVAPSRLRQDLEQAPPARRERMLIARIQAEVAAVMGFEPSNLPDPERGFFEAGMDSLMAVQLRDHLQRAVGTALPATLAFDHPNVPDLARHLLLDVLGLGPTTPVAERPTDPAAARRSDLLEQIKGLSQDTLERLVADELGALDGK